MVHKQIAKEQTLEADIAEEMPEVNLLVATLVATVTFAAAFQLPGGHNDNGLAILRKNTDFRSFMEFDSLAFGFSASSILIHFLAPQIPKSMNVNYPRLLHLFVTESIIYTIVYIVSTINYSLMKSRPSSHNECGPLWVTHGGSTPPV